MAQVQPIIEAAEKAATGIIAEAEAKAKRHVEESRESTEQLATERAKDMWALTDDLIARAEAVRKQSDDLLTALSQTRRGAEAALRARSEGDVSPASPSERPPTTALSPGTKEPPPPAAPRIRQPQPSTHSPPAPSPPAPRPASGAPLGSVQPVGPVQGTGSQAPTIPPKPPPEPAKRPKPARPPSEGARLLATQMAVAGSSREEINKRLRDDFGIEDADPMIDMILGGS